MTFTIESPVAGATLAHVSEKPWSSYTKADYTPDQWHRACLIHQHPADDHTSKSQCKLPVRTPDGALNRNGVHAAAAALGGARGGISATDAELASARTALARLYAQLNEEAPPSLVKHSDMDDAERLIHFGVKGMHWGHRKLEDSGGSGGSGGSSSSGGARGSSGSGESSASGGANQGMSRGKKIAIGTSVAIGAAAAAYLIKRYSGTSVPKGSLTSEAKTVTKAMHPDELLFHNRVDSGQLAHARIMGLLKNKKTELDIAASSAKIDQLLNQPKPKMPSFEDVGKVKRRSKLLSSAKNAINPSPRTLPKLHPAQSVLSRSGAKPVTELDDITSRLLNFNDEALRRGGMK